MISVEINEKQNRVEIFADDAGIDALIQSLTHMRGKRTHDHFMTASWGGQELAEEAHGTNRLVNHLIVYSNVPPQP